MNTCRYTAPTRRVLQVSSSLTRDFFLFGSHQTIKKRITSPQRIISPAAASSSPSNADNSMENYNSRWEQHWKAGPDGDGLKPGQMFDAQRSSPALDALISKISVDDKRVFVPGCGRGYDLVTFVKAGAKEALGLELAPSAVPVANEYVDSRLGSQSSHASVIQGDFFTFNDEQEGFDIGYDYTFLCALMPEMRAGWGPSWRRILRPGGLLITLIFPVDPSMENKGPPWPVTPELYKELLLKNEGFVLKSLEKLPDEQSHPGRAGKEYIAVWERQN